MSIDFELFTSGKISLPSRPTLNTALIQIHGPDKAEDEDIPDPVRAVIGKKRWLYRIHVEGVVQPVEQVQVDAWLGQLATISKGVLINQQSWTYETAQTLGSLTPPTEKQAETGQMRFEFEDGEWFYREGFRAMLDTVAAICPAALPTRYGIYEPFQGKVDDGDCTGLISEFEQSPDQYMKAPAPFGHIFMYIPCAKWFENHHPRHFIRRYHLLANVEFELRPKIFADPRLTAKTMDLFRALSTQLNVVYAEILTRQERSPHLGWYGIPDRRHAHTICIGPAYRQVWPEAAQKGAPLGRDHVILGADRLGGRPPVPPPDLIAPTQDGLNPGAKPAQAKVFPFSYEFDYDRYYW